MRVPFAIALGIVTLVGCNKPRDTGTGETGQAGGMATDTMVTTKQTQDTTLISHDTTVDVDTTKKTGPGMSDSAK